MKKLTPGAIFLAFAGLLFLAVGVLTAADVPDTVVIDNKGYERDRQGPVEFSHRAHSEDYGLECKECHHRYVGGENVWKEGDSVGKCEVCHDPGESKGDVKKLQTAFHTNCKNCHRDVGGDAPYRKCNDCHS